MGDLSFEAKDWDCVILLVGEGDDLKAAFGDPEGDSNMEILSDIGFGVFFVILAMINCLFFLLGCLYLMSFII